MRWINDLINSLSWSINSDKPVSRKAPYRLCLSLEGNHLPNKLGARRFCGNYPLETSNNKCYIMGMAKLPTYKDFLTQFPDDDACLEHLMRTRYGDRHECKGCQKQANYYRTKKRQSYTCEYCGAQVYPKAGTPFEKSRTSLHSWFFAMFLFCASRNGVSAKELERQLGVTYKTAWRMARLIREYMG